jgi:vacuolar-type H+-ATPase subunit H
MEKTGLKETIDILSVAEGEKEKIIRDAGRKAARVVADSEREAKEIVYKARESAEEEKNRLLAGAREKLAEEEKELERTAGAKSGKIKAIKADTTEIKKIASEMAGV